MNEHTPNTALARALCEQRLGPRIVCEKVGIGRQQLNAYLAGGQPLPWIAHAIARELSRNVTDLFPAHAASQHPGSDPPAGRQANDPAVSKFPRQRVGAEYAA